MTAIAWAIVLYTVVNKSEIPKGSEAMANISIILITFITIKELFFK